MSGSFKAGIKFTLRALGRQPLVRQASQIMGITSRPAGANVGISNISIPGVVAVYFGDGADKLYQLIQWLPVLEQLHQRHQVLLVFRNIGAYNATGKISSLPRTFVRRLGDLMDLYDDNELRLVIYVNNSRSNFQSLDHPRLVHVHVNHGESDKLSMVSNKAKAYDKVLVAGPAAIKRHEAMLIDFDLDKLVVVGRPQLDIHFQAELSPSKKFDVLYAPTWEGENEDNNYTSIDLYGIAIVHSLLSNPAFRLIYKPHPRVEGSKAPGVAAAHDKIMKLIEEANANGAEHIVSEQGNILAMFEATDALITDVSSVGLDYLYLQPEKPLIISDRRNNRQRLLRDAPISQACLVIDKDSVIEIDELLESGLLKDELGQSRRDMRKFYFGDLELGQSTTRFQTVVSELIETRETKLVDFRGWHS